MTAHQISPYARSRWKRAFDVMLAALLLVVCVPLFAVCAVLILLRDGRPIFFRQFRVGQGNRLFRIVKFRTMRPASGLYITAAGDRRITATGRWLRKHKLDELPQLWNVLKGDMSLVGPRPEVPEFVDRQSAVWAAILQVRPGITGAASLQYPDEAALLGSVPDPVSHYRQQLLPRKLHVELTYLENSSLFTDISLLLRTGALFLSSNPERQRIRK